MAEQRNREGQQLGNYRLERLLGRGGFAEVYLGHHLRLQRQAAIKILHAYLSEQEIDAFQREAQIIAALDHPHIVRILDFDVQNGVPFLVMDYLPNGTLRQRHSRGERVPLPMIVSYVKQVADALHYAHEQRLIHRDVKPENMLIGRRHEVVLSDFGIAAIAHSTSSMTAQSSVGTIPYMAPEQIQAQPRAASDQYALGVVVYEWLSGELPFVGSFTEIFAKHLMTPPPSLCQKLPTLSPDVEQVVLTALAKDPKRRFASVQAFATALETASQTIQTSRPQPIAPTQEQVTLPASSPLSSPAVSVSPTVQAQEPAMPGTQGAQPPPPEIEVPASGITPPIVTPHKALWVTDSGENIKAPTLSAATGVDETSLLSSETGEAAPSLIKEDEVSPRKGTPETQAAFSSPEDAAPLTASAQKRSVLEESAVLKGSLQENNAGETDLILSPSPKERELVPSFHLVRNKFSIMRTVFITVMVLVIVLSSIAIYSNNSASVAHTNATNTALTQSNRKATVIVLAHESATALSAKNEMATAVAYSNATATSYAANHPYPPQNSSLVLSDPLNKNDDLQWEGGSGYPNYCSFVNGAYHVREIAPPYGVSIAVCGFIGTGSCCYSNFTYEVQMRIISGDCGGLNFRQGTDYAYRFVICSDGSYYLDLWEQGYATPTGELQTTTKRLVSDSNSAINTGLDQLNTIAVVASGSEIDLYVNGRKIKSVNDSTSSDGIIGLIAQYLNSPTDVSYNNLKVWV